MSGVTIAISGRKRAGKDTLASYIMAECPEYEHLSFASLLKFQCASIFEGAVPSSFFYNDAQKDMDLLEVIELDQFVPEMRRVTGLDIQPLGLTASSGRDIMKAYGTQYVRGAKDDYWMANLPKAKYGVITDLRFPNEAAWLRKTRKARVIRVVRGTLLGGPADTHESEAGVDEIWPDLLLVSHNDDKALYKRVGTLLGMGYWKTALDYDYCAAITVLGLMGGGAMELPEAARLAGVAVAAARFLYDYYGGAAPYTLDQVLGPKFRASSLLSVQTAEAHALP